MSNEESLSKADALEFKIWYLKSNQFLKVKGTSKNVWKEVP